VGGGGGDGGGDLYVQVKCVNVCMDVDSLHKDTTFMYV